MRLPRTPVPLVVVKELLDDAVDACEEQDIAPELTVTVDEYGITVADNGPASRRTMVGDSVVNFRGISTCVSTWTPLARGRRLPCNIKWPGTSPEARARTQEVQSMGQQDPKAPDPSAGFIMATKETRRLIKEVV